MLDNGFAIVIDGNIASVDRIARELPAAPHKRALAKPIVRVKSTADPRLYRVTGQELTVSGDVVHLTEQVAPRYDLAEAQRIGREIIDDAADARIISARTQGIGIAAVYESQKAEMLEYLARSSIGEPTPADMFPVLTALVGSSVGADLASVVETIRQRVTSEAQRLATINRRRLDGKAAVAAAQTVDAVAAAVATAGGLIHGA